MGKNPQYWPGCLEGELREKVAAWAKSADLANAIVFLNGEMGAGKSTFARALLEVLAPGQLSKGSPTFPLVQEYRTPSDQSSDQPIDQAIYHIDLYRLKSESELEESGILAQIEDPSALALVEWSSLFPEALAFWLEPPTRSRPKPVWIVDLAPTASDPSRRDVRVSGPFH